MMGTRRIMIRAMALSIALLCGVVAPASAQTSCGATTKYTLDWDTQLPKNTALGTANRIFTVTNGIGGTTNVTMSFAGDTASYIDSGYGQTPNISMQNSGGITAGENTLFLAADFASYTASLTPGANVAAVRFNFSVPVREVTFKILDVDFAANQFRDWIQVVGSNGASTYVPTIANLYGNSNTGTPGATAPATAYVGAGTVSGAAIANGQVNGVTANSTFTQDLGTVTTSFAQPVTQVELRYGNGPTSTMAGTAGIQSISVHDISFCPMPSLTVLKSSTPFVTTLTDPNRFNIPDAYVYYAITVTNSNSSTVDANSIVMSDLLPAQMTFFNGDVDGAGPLTGNFEFIPGTSGLTLGAANITYLDAANTVIPSPPAGDAPTVRTLRWAPQGTMASNSSFTLRFRARIK